jgi:hypothetical protein
MALPLAPVILKYGALALLAWGTQKRLRKAVVRGRTDQRAEDALDDLPEGISSHAPRDRPQRNATFRGRRTLTFAGRTYELDAGLIARWRLRRL